MSSRSSKVEPAELQDILRTSGTIAAKPSPVEHIASPGSQPNSANSSRPSSSRGRNGTTSNTAVETTTAPPRTNRFSVSFPIVPSNSTSPVRSARSPVREAPSVVPESLALLTGPSDGNFLTAIAGQERRVLELKEELVRAEAELSRLKKQWAQHEAHKKKSEAGSATRLQPLQTSFATAEAEEDTDGSNAWMQQEMERRKALLSSNKSSNRTVFSGSKHTRTLSLLSPASGGPTAVSAMPPPSIRPPRKDSLSKTVRRSQEADRTQRKQPPILRATTTPHVAAHGAGVIYPNGDISDNASDTEMLLKSSKKMATDLRDGLWTFWEDLRQATVGEEATKIEPPSRQQNNTQIPGTARKQRSKTSLLPASRRFSTTTPSGTLTDAKWDSPPRPEQNKATTMSLVSAPTLADPAFFTELSSPVIQRETPTKVKKTNTLAVRQDQPISKSSTETTNEDDTWEVWNETSPHGSTASSAVSESTTHPSTVSNAASPRTSNEAAKRTRSNAQLGKAEYTARESGKKDPIPWPALANLGPKALRRTASHLMAEWESLSESQGRQDFLDAAAAGETTAAAGRVTAEQLNG